MPESSTGPDMESDQSGEHHLQPRPTRHSGHLKTAAGPSVATEKDRVATVRALLEKQPWMSPCLKSTDVATVLSKTRSTDPEPRSPERTQHQPVNDSTDDTTADETDSSAQCDIPIHSVMSPKSLK